MAQDSYVVTIKVRRAWLARLCIRIARLAIACGLEIDRERAVHRIVRLMRYDVVPR